MARAQGGAPVSVRLAVVGGPEAKRDFDAIGQSGKKALNEIEHAAHSVSPALRSVDATSRELQVGAERLAHHAGPVGRILADIGPAGIAAGVGIGATVLAVHKAVEVAKDAVESFDKLNETINNLGVDSDFFQGVGFAAKLKGVAPEQFEQAIKTAQLNFGQLEIGIGRTTKQLTAYDSELAKNVKSAATFEDRIKLISNAMEKETDATKRNLLAKIVFGETNTKLAQVFGQGADALDRFIEEAKAFGVVVDKSVLERADKMADQMDIAATVIDLNLKQAFIDLAPIMISAAQLAGQVAAAISDIVDSTRDLENRTRIGPLQADLARLYNQRQALQDRMAAGETDILTPHIAGKAVITETKSIASEIDRLNGEAGKLLDRITELQGRGQKSQDFSIENATRFEQIADSVDRALAGVANKAEKIAKVRAELEDTIASLEVLRGKPGVDSAELDKTIAAARETAGRQIAELQKAETKHARSLDEQTVKELRNLSEKYSATQKYAELLQKLDDAKARGFLSDQEYDSARLRAQEELNDALEKQKQKELEAANTFGSGLQLGLRKYAEEASDVAGQVSEVVTSAFQGMEDALVEFVTTGKASFSDLARSILADIARIAIRQAIIGPIARALGGAFGGGAGAASGLPSWGGPRDAGGPTRPDAIYQIGKGPYTEWFSPHSPGAIATASHVAAAMGGGSRGKVELNVHVSGARGNAEIKEMAMAGAAEVLAAYDSHIDGRIRGNVADMAGAPMIAR